MKITNFSVFKNKEKKNEQSPDYTLSVNIGTKEKPEYIYVGAGWAKEANGNKFLSFKLSEPFGAKQGAHIEIDPAPLKPSEVPKVDRDSQGNEINADDINF